MAMKESCLLKQCSLRALEKRKEWKMKQLLGINAEACLLCLRLIVLKSQYFMRLIIKLRRLFLLVAK